MQTGAYADLQPRKTAKHVSSSKSCRHNRPVSGPIQGAERGFLAVEGYGSVTQSNQIQDQNQNQGQNPAHANVLESGAGS